MARDEFFADVRRAVTFMAPRVQADSPFTDTNYIQKMLRGADLWLTRKVVEAFQPDDFADLDEGVRDALINFPQVNELPVNRYWLLSVGTGEKTGEKK